MMTGLVDLHFSFDYNEAEDSFAIDVPSTRLVHIRKPLMSLGACFKLNFSLKDLEKSDELVYYILSEIETQCSSSSNQQQLATLRAFLQLCPQFKRGLIKFLYDETVRFYHRKILNASQQFTIHDTKQYWLNVINQNRSNLTISEMINKSTIKCSASATSIGPENTGVTLARLFNEIINSEYSFNLLRQEHLYAIEYNLNFNQLMHATDPASREAWTNRLCTIKSKQQRLYNKLLHRLYNELTGSKKPMSKSRSSSSLSVESIENLEDEDIFSGSTTSRSTSHTQSAGLGFDHDTVNTFMMDKSYAKIEESYTIQLGAQLKTTHNLRLIRCDILDYCRNRFKFGEEVVAANRRSVDDSFTTTLTDFVEPDSILTSMYLYSENKLCALVLLVDSSLSTHSYSCDTNANSESQEAIPRRFAQICHRNGYDFHFGSIDQQIENVVNNVNKFNSTTDEQSAASKTTKTKLRIGDYYTTRHSNLSKAHVVYHLAAYDSQDQASSSLIQSLKKSELSSRHSVILGLRNVLKSCFANNIHTITFPLLLTHQMTEVTLINIVIFKLFCFIMIKYEGNDDKLGNEAC